MCPEVKYLYSANKHKCCKECERAKGMHAISHIWETPSDAEVQQTLIDISNAYKCSPMPLK